MDYQTNPHTPTGVAVKVYRDRVTCTYHGTPNTQPPTPSTTRYSYGLNRKQVSKLTRAGNLMRSINGRVYMYTLTFPDPDLTGAVKGEAGTIEAIPHDEAGRKLSAWLKRVKRIHPDLLYSWVAEIQPKRLRRTGVRAIHYHLITPTRLDRVWCRKTWSEVVGSVAVIHRSDSPTAGYETKYQTKEGEGDSLTDSQREERLIYGNRCAISQSVSALLKPVASFRFPRSNWAEVAEAVHDSTAFPAPKYFASGDYFFLSHWGFDRNCLSLGYECTSINGGEHHRRRE